MSDENKEPMVDQKKEAEEKTRLSEEALSNVTGGGTPQQKATTTKTETLPVESITLNYSKVEY
jgi:hypothetical protein